MIVAFQVRFVEDIDWNDKAFGSVVMDPDRKELIHELVKSQISGAAQFDDLVKGKGEHLVNSMDMRNIILGLNLRI